MYNILLLFVFYSGIGASLVFAPTIGHVSLYFEKKRGLANGVGTAASSVGTLVCAPLLTFLLDYYGLKGTLLLVGGASSHLFIVGMLLRPTEFYRLRWVKNTANHNDALEIPNEDKDEEFVQYRGRRLSLTEGNDNDTFQGVENDEDKYVNFRGRKLSIGAGPDDKDGDQDNKETDTRETITLPIPPPEKETCCHFPENLSFLRQPGYILHVITMVFVFFGLNLMNVILIPTLAKEVGFTQYQGAYLISIHAVGDGVGRLFFGWLLDTRFLPKPVLLALILVAMGTLMMLYPMTGNNFNAAAGMIVLVGFTFGIGFPANFTLLSDKCRLEVLQRALGVMFLVLAIPMVFFLQIPGYIT